MGKLVGVSLTPELRAVLNATLSLPQPENPEGGTKVPQDQSDALASASLSSSPPRRTASTTSPPALLERARRARRDLSQPPPTTQDSRSALEAADTGGGKKTEKPVLPLEGVQAIKLLITNSRSEPDEKEKLIQRLDSALRRTTLSFAPKASKRSNPEFEKRLERLRLQDEERSYMSLTTNLKNAASLKDDNVTAKSMMFATSVGLNMVVAPISFGVFMYFFAGSIFGRFFDDDADGGNGGANIDIRRVIAGVVSGVFMLFVEMILFVIRSHELDASVRKKGRRRENRANPFGYTQKNMERVYIRDD